MAIDIKKRGGYIVKDDLAGQAGGLRPKNEMPHRGANPVQKVIAVGYAPDLTDDEVCRSGATRVYRRVEIDMSFISELHDEVGDYRLGHGDRHTVDVRMDHRGGHHRVDRDRRGQVRGSVVSSLRASGEQTCQSGAGQDQGLSTSA